MSTTTPAFGAQILGQTEKALNAILDRQLARALKVTPATAQARIAGLADAQLLQTGGGDEPQVTLTDAGQQLHGQIRGAVTKITERMWGDLPAADLVTAGRVLSVVLARANAELGAA